MNKRMTLEDPPEYYIPNVQATPIAGTKEKLDFFHDLQVKAINEEIKKAKTINRIQKF